MGLLNHLDVLRNDILIFDALDLARGPIAAVHLPIHLRLGLHGNFVEQRDIDEWEKRRGEAGDLGPAQAAKEPLPWQVRLGVNSAATNGVNGVNGGQH